MRVKCSIISCFINKMKRLLAAAVTIVTAAAMLPLLPVHSSAADERIVRIPCDINDLLRLDENGDPYGYCFDYLNKLAELNGWKYEYVSTTWTEAVEMLDNGSLDILFPTNFEPERVPDMEYSALTGGYFAAGLFANTDSDYDYEDFESWNGVRIAVTRNSSNEQDLEQFAKKNNFTYQPVYIASMEDKISALHSGEADMIIFSVVNYVPDAKLLSLLNAAPFYYTVKKGNTELLEELDSGMQKLLTGYPELVSDTQQKSLMGDNRTAQALTGEERDFLKSGKEIVVGFYADTQPLSYIDKDGSYCGVYPDLMNVLREESGLNIVLKPVSRKQNWREHLKNGDIDFYIGASAAIAEMDPNLRTTDNFYDYMSILITRNDCNFKNIDKPVIALTNGRSYWGDYIEDIMGEVSIEFYESAKECLDAVVKGNADGTMIGNYEYNYYSKNPRFTALTTWENFSLNARGGLTSLKSIDPVIFSAVNKSLYCLDQATVREIVNTNLNMPYDQNFSDTLYSSRYILSVIFILVILSIVTCVVIMHVRSRQRSAIEAAREKEREHLKILAALSHDYYVVYFTDLNSDICHLIKLSEGNENSNRDRQCYSEAMLNYINKRVIPEYRDTLIALADPEEIIRRFRTQTDFAVRYRVNPNENRREFYEMHFVDAGENDSDHFMVFGIRCVDDIAKEELSRKQLLQDALEAAERANSAKSDFLSRMSHDMRTPLNAVLGMTAIAETNIGDPNRVKDALNKISVSGKHLLGLVNDVLDMSRIESGKLSINEAQFDLSALLTDMTTMIHPQIRMHNHTYTADLSGIVHKNVIGDSLRLQQIFMNILSNSVKYTPDGGLISLRVSEKPAAAAKAAIYEFVFTDNGIGMSKEYLEHIFEPFSREEDPRTSSIKGTGLGMSITRNILHIMNGSIVIESEQDKGSVFTVTIPMRITDGPAENKSSGRSGDQSALSEIKKNDFSGKRILIAEDNPLNMEIACEILKMTGADITEAENGRIALEKFAGSEVGYFDLIFMDLQMPEMNGIEAAKAIRQLERPDASAIPIVAMTANAFTEDINATKAAGMNEHLAKPVDLEKFSGVLKKYLG